MVEPIIFALRPGPVAWFSLFGLFGGWLFLLEIPGDCARGSSFPNQQLDVL